MLRLQIRKHFCGLFYSSGTNKLEPKIFVVQESYLSVIFLLCCTNFLKIHSFKIKKLFAQSDLLDQWLLVNI